MSNHGFLEKKRSQSLPLSLLIILFFCFGVAQTQAQERTETQKRHDDDDVVRVRSNLVSIDVMVKDKKGKYVSDLRPEDFTIFENGVQQKLAFFDSPLVGSNGATRREVKSQTEQFTLAEQPRNFVSLVLDGQTTDITNLKRVREASIKYVREQISDTDTVALFAVTSGLQLLQPFTQDKTKLISALENAGSVSTSSKNFEQRDIAENIASLREQLNNPNGPPSPTTADAGSQLAQVMIASRVLQQFIVLRTALSLQQSRPILAALAAICEGLRTVPGKKTLVLFSQGFVTPAVLDWQVQSTIDIANRANVAIYIIDSAGLRAGGPRSGSIVPASPLEGVSAITNQEQRIQAVGGETVFDNTRQEGENREYDILYRMSEDTGGRFFKGNNDIGQGLERISEEIRSRYTLAYRSTNQNFDGTFRKLKIQAGRPGTQLVSRSGYYAIAPEEIVPLSPEHKKLLSGFAEAEAAPGLPIFVELSPFRSQEGRYLVPVSIELPPTALKMERRGEKRFMQLEVLGVIRGTSDKILSRLGGSFDVSLSPEQYESILANNIFYRQDLELVPGEYNIDLIVRDRQSGKTAARREKLVLTEPGAEFAATNAVLSRHVEPANHRAAGSAESGDVLSYKMANIRPSPSRQFQASDNLIVFLSVYNAAKSAETGSPLVRITVRLMKDGQAATKPFDFVLTETQTAPVPHLTFAGYIRLSGLAAGKYTAMIEAQDMVTRKLLKQDAPFVIGQ